MATANYYYVFHLYRFTYYERYEELMKEGRSESNARAEATAAAETAVKNAVLPYKVSPVVQLQPPVAASVATATLVQGAPSAPESIAQAAGPLAKR